MPVLCVTNQKGGCGKTVTATNLAAGLARRGKKTLIVDFDPQAPVASCLGVQSPAKPLRFQPFVEGAPAAHVIFE